MSQRSPIQKSTNHAYCCLTLATCSTYCCLLARSDFTFPPNDRNKYFVFFAEFKRPSKVFKYPKESSLIPDHVPYLLIGGGTASFSAFRAIKSADPTAKVLVVGNESFNPYMRPPLSKEMFYNDNRDLAKSLRFKQWNASERR